MYITGVFNGGKFSSIWYNPFLHHYHPPPPTTHHHPPPTTTKKICFKRLKRRGWYKLKSVPRGDGFGSWGSTSLEVEIWCVKRSLWPVLISLWSLLYHRFKPRWMLPRLRRSRSKAKLRQPRRVRLSSGTDLVQVHRAFCFCFCFWQSILSTNVERVVLSFWFRLDTTHTSTKSYQGI